MLLPLSSAVSYLASSSSGVSAHLVVRVVVTAFESAPPDAAESSESSTIHRSHILKPTPEGTEELGSVAKDFHIAVKVELKINSVNDSIILPIVLHGSEERSPLSHQSRL